MNTDDTFYRRRLPHWEKSDSTYFITFRVAGSLPKNLSADAETELKNIAQRLKDQGRPPSEYELERTLYCERLLDDDRSNPVLARPELAALVRDVLLFHNGKKYDLLAWCIMPNHVHLLLKPLSRNATAGDGGVPSLAEIMHSIKSYSAKEAKKSRLITGNLWQREYFDRWVRNDMELNRYLEYIRQNPVVAGLARSPEEYPWLGTPPSRW